MHVKVCRNKRAYKIVIFYILKRNLLSYHDTCAVKTENSNNSHLGMSALDLTPWISNFVFSICCLNSVVPININTCLFLTQVILYFQYTSHAKTI